MPVQDDASISTFADQLLISLRSDWTLGSLSVASGGLQDQLSPLLWEESM